MIPEYHWTSLCVSLDSHYEGKLAFSMHTKAITVNLYTFYRNMSAIRGPFQGTDNTNSSHTEHLRSGQTACPSFPDPYLCPPQPMIPVCSCYSFSGTANFTLNNGSVVKHNHCCALSDSLISVLEWLAHHAGQQPFIVYLKRQVVVFHVPHLFIIKVPGRVSIMWIVKLDIL